MMSFTNAVKTSFKLKLTKFNGRASRSEYWWSMLFLFLSVMVLAFVYGLLEGLLGSIGSIVGLIIFVAGALFLLVGGYAVMFRRFHDLNFDNKKIIIFAIVIPVVLNAISSQFVFLSILSLIYSIGLIVMLCRKGTEGSNDFGEDPLVVQAQSNLTSQN